MELLADTVIYVERLALVALVALPLNVPEKVPVVKVLVEGL